jgi:hypothetical protein
MRHFAFFALLSTAGLIACSKSPLGPTQATTAGSLTTPGTATAPGVATAPGTAAAPAGTATTPASDASDCEQTGENTGECGSQAGDATETPGSETPETPGTESPETPGSENAEQP